MPECVHAFVEWLHRWQEFIGGLIGAAGAVWAVYLTLGKQRKEETKKVSSAVATEVAALVKYVIGAVEICIEIAKGARRVPQTDAGYIVRKVLAKPTVYNAVADRVGLLPHPDATTQFYFRIEEVKAAASAVETAVKFQWTPGIGGSPPLMTEGPCVADCGHPHHSFTASATNPLRHEIRATVRAAGTGDHRQTNRRMLGNGEGRFPGRRVLYQCGSTLTQCRPLLSPRKPTRERTSRKVALGRFR